VKQILLGNGAGIGKNGRYKFFLMDEKPTVVPVSSVGEQSGRAWCSAKNIG